MENLENLAGEVKSLEGEKTLMQPGIKAKEKRGRGRPRKESGPSMSPPPQADTMSPQPQVVQLPTKDIVKPVFQIISTWAGRAVKDKKAEMMPEEMDAITTASAMVLDKWAPLLVGSFGAEIMLVTVLSTWGMRVYAIHSTNEQEKRKREREDPTGQRTNGVAEKHRETVRDFSHVVPFAPGPQPS